MICLENVSYSYADGFSLKSLSLKLNPGEILTLVGPNGAGKSTLIKLAAGHIKPFSGSITLEETPLAKLKSRDIAKRLAYLSQSGLQSQLPVEEIVLHGRFPHTPFPHHYGKCDQELAKKALKQMGIEHLAKRSFSALSGGERQKAMIAMALCQNAETILLDEPTAFLDPFHQIYLMEQLKALSVSGKSILCVLHDLPLALRFSDRIAVMENGELLTLDTPKNVLKNGILAKVFGIELLESGNGFYFYGDRKKDTE